jgi:hypothetical protein
MNLASWSGINIPTNKQEIHCVITGLANLHVTIK